MAIAHELLSEFAKVAVPKTESKKEETIFGTAIKQGENMFVRIDGSEILTPVDTTATVKDRERVTVMIKDHTATITGNVTSPSAADADLKELDRAVGEFKKVTTDELFAKTAEIEDLKVTKLDAQEASITYATIKNLEVAKAVIEDLKVKKLDAAEAEIKYANIDFANIGKAAIENFLSKSGMIGDLVVGDGTITGTLVGVTIKGDLIEGGTVIADKLVVKGSDGLYYKLNTDGMKIEAEQTDYNSLNGSIITAKSITATKISVDDLVAFDATIGGFKITSDSIHSVVKETVDNTTRGIYMDNSGQLNVGDSRNYIKYSKDTNGSYKLSISADDISFTSDTNIVNFQDINNSVNNNSNRLSTSESIIRQISNQISMMVTDENGSSMMTQTSDGWTFNMGDVLNKINEAVSDLGQKTSYIIMTTDDIGNPCIELGKSGNPFKVRITNTSVDFMEGSSKIAYISNKSLYIERAIIKDELQIGEGRGFIWKRRANGNMGLRWVGD